MHSNHEEIKKQKPEVVITDLADPSQDELRHWLFACSDYPSCVVHRRRNMVFFKLQPDDPKLFDMVKGLDAI